MGLTVSRSPSSACAHMPRLFHGLDCFTVSTCCTYIDLGGLGYFGINVVLLYITIWILMVQSGHKCAHVMTSLLWWHVQSSGLITIKSPQSGGDFMFSFPPPRLGLRPPPPLQWLLLLTSKLFEHNLRYLGQRKYRFEKMYWMIFCDLDPRSRLWHW